MTDYERLWRDEKARREELEEELRQYRTLKVERIEPLRMTRVESAFIYAMLDSRVGTVVSRDTLLDAAESAAQRDNLSKMPHVIVCRLRQKLTPIDVHIETVWGRGYRLPQASRDAWQRAVDKHRAALEAA